MIGKILAARMEKARPMQTSHSDPLLYIQTDPLPNSPLTLIVPGVSIWLKLKGRATKGRWLS